MTTSFHVPGQIRRHVLKKGRAAAVTPGEVHLYAACQEGARALESRGMNSLNSIDLSLTNAALGAALEIARDWLTSDNGNNVMAAKSLLKFELEYEPSDPREIRHGIKMPKSLSGYFVIPYGSPSPYEKESETIQADMGRMSWTTTGASGRVRAETLGFLLRKMTGMADHPHPATSRAAKKFASTYTGAYETTQKLITSYLAKDETALDFTEAVHGRDEPEGEVEGPAKWTSGELRAVMNLTGRGASPVIWFGGKAGKKSPYPREWRTVVVTSLGSGKYQLTDMETERAVLTASLTSHIHWAPAETAGPPLVEGPERQAPEEKSAAKPELYEPPANWVELAEEGNTPQARAYWARRCEEFRRTGK
ncbi:hypothetical protein ACFTUC_17315 [Streptomyces sp. NPDC056944]|uniref:hypothetical protein n=1 Tax=Streptomyces sp. NPDC056944 TaxID=3345972 RepID=UPI0036374820